MCAKNNSVCDLRKYRELRANSLGRTPLRLGEMHGEKIVSAQLFAFSLEGCEKRRPVGVRNPLALFPLGDGPLTFANVGRHLGDGLPCSKHIAEACHMLHHGPDELSGQVRIKDPMKSMPSNRTICPMGRGRTSPKLIDDVCSRTRAARQMAGHADQAAFAKLMGIKPDTYARYEQRLPLPHRYFARFVELTGADLNIVLTGKPRPETRKAV